MQNDRVRRFCGDEVIIEPRKLRDYLLSPTHPIGRFKAVFFRKLGYSQDEWAHLEKDLRKLVDTGEIIPGAASFYGRKYEIRGLLSGPSGIAAELVSIWIILTKEENARFVTAFPGAGK